MRYEIEPESRMHIAPQKMVSSLTVHLAVTTLVATCATAQNPAAEIRGFSPAAAQTERRVEASLARQLNRDSTGAFFRYLTDEPHPAGSVRNKELADFIADRYRAWGLDHVQLHRYDVLLPWPREVRVTMTSPTVYEATLREDAYPQDPHTAQDAGITYLGMSASGDVTGELIYAASGNPSDYDWLEQHGVDLKGKIALAHPLPAKGEGASPQPV